MRAPQNRLARPVLALNAAVLWNTRYLDAAVVRLRAERPRLKDKDVAHLSPLSGDLSCWSGRL
ncbi:Tn3 family transposase [Streptomyces anulatus]